MMHLDIHLEQFVDAASKNDISTMEKISGVNVKSVVWLSPEIVLKISKSSA